MAKRGVVTDLIGEKGPEVIPLNTSGNWHYYTPSYATGTAITTSPNVLWQNTSSNATYSSAASVLSAN